MLIQGYETVLIFTLAAFAFGMFVFLVAKIVRPSAPNEVKNSTYECGVEPFGDSWIQYDLKYYLYALLFILFDVETIFLLPWAVAYHQLGLFAFFEILIFISILLIGLVYAWKKNMLRWD